MLGHLGINVPDLPAAKAYYDEVLAMLGFEEFFSTVDQAAYRPTGGKRGTYLFLYPSTEDAPYSRHRTGLQHLAFSVPTRSAVDAVHQRVQQLGNEVVHPPQPFPQYPPPYYATFWLDSFGFLLEAVCHVDQD